MSTQVETFKIITVGDSTVGKTSIIRRYIFGQFKNDTMSTIGVNFSYKEVAIDDKNKIKLKLIDTAGQEKYQSLSKSYFKNADCVLFIFALNDEKSFHNITKWINLFKENYSGKEGIIQYLVGNKQDLGQTIEEEEIEKFSKEVNMKYKAVSAFANYNIEELFLDIAKEAMKNYKPNKKQTTVTLEDQKKKKDNACAKKLCSGDA